MTKHASTPRSMYLPIILKNTINFIDYLKHDDNIVVFSSRMINIQLEMAERCMELLMLPEDETCLLLDLGCGSGLSGSVSEESGHVWFGMDISESMLSMLLYL